MFIFSEVKLYIINGLKCIGYKYKKVCFYEFIDDIFIMKKERKIDYEKYFGIMGLIIRVEIGDIVEVVLKNMVMKSYLIYFDGLFYK